MLTKNIYILYPAGYMGTYLNWIISVSDIDLSAQSVFNPVTNIGNAHAHIKRPTHQSWDKTLTWIAFNRPHEKLIYAINCREDADYRQHAAFAAQNILRIDPDPVIINIHDRDEPDLIKFGAVSMFTKWPTFMSALAIWHNDYNPGLDTDTVRARNWLYQNWKKFNPGNPKINSEEILYNLKTHKKWIDLRKAASPGEITDDQYCIPVDISEKHIYDIGIDDIVSDDFIEKFELILTVTDSGNFDFSYSRKFHPAFLNKQTTILWFDSVQLLRQQSKFSPWFNTNAMTQAMFLLEFPEEIITGYLDLETSNIASILTH